MLLRRVQVQPFVVAPPGRADFGGAIENHHLAAGATQAGGDGQTCGTRADDDGFGRGHQCASRNSMTERRYSSRAVSIALCCWPRSDSTWAFGSTAARA